MRLLYNIQVVWVTENFRVNYSCHSRPVQYLFTKPWRESYILLYDSFLSLCPLSLQYKWHEQNSSKCYIHILYIVWHLIISQHFMNMTALPLLAAYRLQRLGLSDQVKQNNINMAIIMARLHDKAWCPVYSVFCAGILAALRLVVGERLSNAVCSSCSFSAELFALLLSAWLCKAGLYSPFEVGWSSHSSAASGTACQNKQVKKDRVHAEVNKMAAMVEVSWCWKCWFCKDCVQTSWQLLSQSMT